MTPLMPDRLPPWRRWLRRSLLGALVLGFGWSALTWWATARADAARQALADRVASRLQRPDAPQTVEVATWWARQRAAGRPDDPPPPPVVTSNRGEDPPRVEAMPDVLPVLVSEANAAFRYDQAFIRLTWGNPATLALPGRRIGRLSPRLDALLQRHLQDAPPGTWTAADREAVRHALAEPEVVDGLRLLDEAGQLPACRWDHDDGERLSPALMTEARWVDLAGQVLALAVRHDALGQAPDRAALGRHLRAWWRLLLLSQRQQATLVLPMTASRAETAWHGTMAQVGPVLAPADRQALLADLAQADARDDVLDALATSILTSGNAAYRLLDTGQAPADWWSWRDSPGWGLPIRRLDEGTQYLTALQALDHLGQPGATGDGLVDPWYAVGPRFCPIPARLWTIAQAVQTRRRLTATALRLEAVHAATGTYPATLADLPPAPPGLDPVECDTGTPFRYEGQAGTGFLLTATVPDGGGPTSEPHRSTVVVAWPPVLTSGPSSLNPAIPGQER